jgi:predicted CXXCH cytochrome family protein
MKMIKFLFMLLFVAVSAAGFGQIANSKHDFSKATWNTSVGDQICIVCHTPHNAKTGVSNAPLWNHELSAVTSYTIYDKTISPTLNATVGQPSGLSKLCLSCHDGTVGIADFGGATGGTEKVPAGSNFGTSLSNDHPISFTYDAALATADGGLKDPTTTNSGQGGTITNDWLSGGKLECSSCHDVHNAYGQTSLLRVSNAGSALCLTCHNK